MKKFTLKNQKNSTPFSNCYSYIKMDSFVHIKYLYSIAYKHKYINNYIFHINTYFCIYCTYKCYKMLRRDHTDCNLYIYNCILKQEIRTN